MNGSQLDDDTTAAIAKALGHPARIRIMRLLAEQPECRGADVFGELPLAQSTVSQHLAVLRDAGLVATHTVGTASVHCLVPEALRRFSAGIISLSETTPRCTDSEECR